jgi:exopolysaccharide biosynthesis polyprenyl glycosylphosphotransferase
VNPSFLFYQGIALALIPFWTGIFALHGLYQRRNLLGGIQEYSLIFRAITIGILIVIVFGFLEPGFILARGWLLLSWLLALLLVSAGRFSLRRLVYTLRRRGYLLSPAVLIGVNEEAHSLAQQLVNWQTSGLHIVGFVDSRMARDVQVYRHLRVLGSIADLQDLIDEYNIEELILATSALSREDIVNIFRHYGFVSGVNLRLSSGLFEIVTTGLQVKEMGYVPLVRINPLRMTGMDRLLKLVLDYAITLPALLFLIPLFCLIALAIRLDSRGPIIYRRRVMGLHGRQFDAFKFRTMHVNGDEILAKYPELKEELKQNQKLKDDPRITRIGRFLRKLSLDESLQLINVLKREMSLVGPRIITTEEMSRYEQWSMNLLTVYPGITGLWQVSGRSDLSFEERVQLDMRYIRNWTIWSDLQILLQTIPAVLRGNGAY